MGVAAKGRGAVGPPWIFIHDTDNVEEGLMCGFSDLFFPLPPTPLEIFLPRPLCLYPKTWNLEI